MIQKEGVIYMPYSQSITVQKSVKTIRLEARAKPEFKKHLDVAAALLGISISKFILMSAEEFANKVISKYQTLKLNKEDSLALLQDIKNPERANKNLRDAFKDYQQSVSSNI
jgi:uncharacterized protein (DUF1778 family)